MKKNTCATETPKNEVNCDVSERAVIPLTGLSGHIFRRDGAMREGRGLGVIGDVVRGRMKRILVFQVCEFITTSFREL